MENRKMFKNIPFAEIADKIVSTPWGIESLVHDMTIQWNTTPRGNKKLTGRNTGTYKHGKYDQTGCTVYAERLHLTEYKIGKMYAEIFTVQLIAVEREQLYNRICAKFGEDKNVPEEMLERGHKLGITDIYTEMDSGDCNFWTAELDLLNKKTQPGGEPALCERTGTK